MNRELEAKLYPDVFGPDPDPPSAGTAKTASEKPSALFRFTEEEVMNQALANHPGLTQEKFLEMKEAFGF